MIVRRLAQRIRDHGMPVGCCTGYGRGIRAALATRAGREPSP